MDPSIKELLEIIKDLLDMEELDLGDHSQLPEDHPIARGEYILGIYGVKK